MKRSTSLDVCKTIQIQKGLNGKRKIILIFQRRLSGAETKRRNKKKGALQLPFSNVNPQTHNVRSISDVK